MFHPRLIIVRVRHGPHPEIKSLESIFQENRVVSLLISFQQSSQILRVNAENLLGLFLKTRGPLVRSGVGHVELQHQSPFELLLLLSALLTPVAPVPVFNNFFVALSIFSISLNAGFIQRLLLTEE